VLAADVVSYTDGNGARNAAHIAVAGRETVAKFVRAFRPRFWPGTTQRWITANGRPSILVLRGDEVFAYLTIGASAAGIEQLLWVLTPDKLSRIAAAAPD